MFSQQSDASKFKCVRLSEENMIAVGIWTCEFEGFLNMQTYVVIQLVGSDVYATVFALQGRILAGGGVMSFHV